MDFFKKSKQITRGKTLFSILQKGLLLVMFFVGGQLMAQQTITGLVTDDQGPLPGATIVVKGTSNGVTTDFDGNFSIKASEGDILVVSFVGFENQEVTMSSNQSIVNVSLTPDNELEEVVVTGYGTQKKVNLTGAVAAVSGEVLQDRPILNVGEGLQGVIPNLNIDIRNGDPTTSPEFNIRGFESINGGSPLILVDNVPMDIGSLNPNDIESISVLKDASSAAIYGARAAFGVILITTKKGKKGKATVNLSTEFSWGKPIMRMDPITDPFAYATARNVANLSTNGAVAYDDDYMAAAKIYSDNPTPENAWFRDGTTLNYVGYNDFMNTYLREWIPQQRHNLSVSGATEKSNYYVSLGFIDKKGWIKNDDHNIDYDRYNVLAKVNYEINDWLEMDTKALITIEENDQPHFYNWDVNINSFARMGARATHFPDLPFYLIPGDRSTYEQHIGQPFMTVSPIPYYEQGGRNLNKQVDVLLTQGITIKPMKNMKVRAEFSPNYTYVDIEDQRTRVRGIEAAGSLDLSDGGNNLVYGNGFSNTDYMEKSFEKRLYYVFNAYADYTFEPEGSPHYAKATLGFNQEYGKQEYLRGKAYSLITPKITNINATVGSQEAYGSANHTSLRGVFYRLNYIFQDKYLLELNGRYDASSRFPTEDRYDFFPSFSAGWKISEESFMQDLTWIDNLKVRGSYGELGNQLLGDDYYPYIPTMGSGTSNYLTGSGSRAPYVSPAGLVSSELTWEKVSSTNFGIDATLLGDKLDVSFDVFTRVTKDMLMMVEQPSILGTSAPKTNAADLETKGWELSATWKDQLNQDWYYGVTLALSDSQAEITKYDNPTGALSEYYTGQKIGEIWGYKTDGLFQNDADIKNDLSALGNNWKAGDLNYRDTDGNGIVEPGNNTLANPGDRGVIGNSSLRYRFGINIDLRYKNWSLNTFFQGILKGDYFPPTGNWNAFWPWNAGNAEWYYITDSWSPTNRDAYFPGPHIGYNDKKNYSVNDRYLQDASYIRLKQLTLNYKVPADIVSQIGVRSLNVYYSGQNLWDATNMRAPLDPEVRPTLTQEYYKNRTHAFGLKIGL
jgi:TonB-linked SusC/RagA family outer membrane protein